MAYPLTAAMSAPQITPRPATRTSITPTAAGAPPPAAAAPRAAAARLPGPVQRAPLPPLGHGPGRVEPFGLGRGGPARRRAGLRIRRRVLPSEVQAVGPGGRHVPSRSRAPADAGRGGPAG